MVEEMASRSLLVACGGGGGQQLPRAGSAAPEARRASKPELAPALRRFQLSPLTGAGCHAPLPSPSPSPKA